MVNLVIVSIITALITIFGGGAGYLIWIKTRPKVITWNAKVYQLSGGSRVVKTDVDGKIISRVTLKDLKPYALDILEKIERAPGITIYRLKKLNIATPAVEGDVVDYWGEGKKEVHVVIHKNAATLLKKGYDVNNAQLIFNPLPHNRINILKSEIALKKERLKKDKDILAAITPWIVTGICMIGLIAIAYIMIDGYVSVAEKLESGIGQMNAMSESFMQKQLNIEELRSGVVPTPNPIGKQPDIPVDTVNDG